MGDEVRVETDDLRRKAWQINAIPWASPMGQTPVVPPDGLSLAKTAVENLRANATALWQYQTFGEREGERLAETLQSVATAYDNVDNQAAQDFDSEGAPTITPEMPAPNKIPPPARPTPLGTQSGLSASEYLDVETAQRHLEFADQGASLREAAGFWRANAQKIIATAETFTTEDLPWEGEAADEAYAKFKGYREWLKGLGESWNELAGEAESIAAAHDNTLSQHADVYRRYMELKAQMQAMIQQNVGGGAAHNIALQMEKLQKESEEIRWGYAREGQPRQIQPEDPPPTGVPTAPVTSNGDPRKPGGPGQTPDGGPGSPGGPQSPGGPAAGGPAAMPQGMGQPTGAGSPSGGGAPSGGGSPSGSGAPSGGGAPGGAPGGPPGGGPSTGAPKLPTDPSLRPAAASGGGGSGAGAGGGGGGGMPATPMSAAVTPETVAPAPPTRATAGGSPGTATTGGGVGGMGGGMAPMGHGAGAQQGKEKRRDPRLAPDEDLYTEDRPWTEAVIGNRRRRDVQDGKESK